MWTCTHYFVSLVTNSLTHQLMNKSVECEHFFRVVINTVYELFVLKYSVCKKKLWLVLWKPNRIMHFSNSSLINNYYLLNQMYALAKFQPDTPITFWVMALQSSNSKMIDLYSKHCKNKLQALVTYEWNVVVTCTIVYDMNRGIHYWMISFSLYHSSSLCTQIKSVKKSQLLTVVLTWHKQRVIHLLVLYPLAYCNDSNFRTPLEQVNKMIYHWTLSSSRKMQFFELCK